MSLLVARAHSLYVGMSGGAWEAKIGLPDGTAVLGQGFETRSAVWAWCEEVIARNYPAVQAAGTNGG